MENRIYFFIGVFAVTLTLINTVSGQAKNQIVDGPCSRFRVTDQVPFFKKLFMGTWYVYASYDYGQIIGLDCLATYYQLLPDGNARSFLLGKNFTTNRRVSFQNTYYFDRPGVGYYTFEQGPKAEPVDLPLVDYNKFYIEFSCVDIDGGKGDCYIGVFTRVPFPSLIVASRINDYINTHNIDRSKLRYINHDKAKCIF